MAAKGKLSSPNLILLLSRLSSMRRTTTVLQYYSILNANQGMAAVYKTLSGTSSKSDQTNGASIKKNKQRVLILSSRGVTYRHRHLLNDLYALLPHSRKDAKLDTKTKLYQLNELADLYNCNNVLFFEARKGKDLYIWMSKAPNGPTVKYHMQNRMFSF